MWPRAYGLAPAAPIPNAAHRIVTCARRRPRLLTRRDVETSIAALDEFEAAAVGRFLGEIAGISERHADELVRRADHDEAAKRSLPSLRLLS
jgi:hypothetical protein